MYYGLYNIQIFYSIKHQLFLPSYKNTYKNTYNGKSIKLNSLKIDHVQEILFVYYPLTYNNNILGCNFFFLFGYSICNNSFVL